ncbi:MAG: ribosomal protein L7/L12 [Clostridia bacterium]|nr:ribosomal protein L7/L12 [Clostridia bacterium]
MDGEELSEEDKQYLENEYSNIDGVDAQTAKRIETLLGGGQKLEAIKIYREATGAGLAEAKEAVEEYAKENGIDIPVSQPAKSSGCYVATAVYGSYDCPEVWTLRRYRDYTLAQTWYGKTFIKIYYTISPTLVKWFGHTELFKRMWKGTLDRMVANLQTRGVESTPYIDKNW